MHPSVPLGEVVDYLDQYLKIREIPDDPRAINGLQVENSGPLEVSSPPLMLPRLR